MASTGDPNRQAVLDTLSRERPVLIAGPTASGKSALALEIAARHGGVIVNADASQVYDCWRIITARPSIAEESAAPHRLYGHKDAQTSYSTGHWLRDVAPLLNEGPRCIIVGGTGLYFSALTQGLADIPATPEEIRREADVMDIGALVATLDPETTANIDIANRARVQRAWEVQRATGRSLLEWQRQTPPPILPVEQADTIVMDADKDWLNARIERRVTQMIDEGAVEEARAVQPDYDPTLPAHRAIGAPEFMAHLNGEISLKETRARCIIATRQFAKRQRTWFRSKMSEWQHFTPHRHD